MTYEKTWDVRINIRLCSCYCYWWFMAYMAVNQVS